MIGWRAHFPHYRRHLDPILAELNRQGYNTAPEPRPTMLVASRIDAQRVHWVDDRHPQPERIILVEHGTGQPYSTDRGILDGGGGGTYETVTLFLAPSQRVADMMAPMFPNATLAVVGSPALEATQALRNATDTPKTDVVFTCHWQSTMKSVARESYTSWPWSRDVLLALADEFGDRVVAHGHPRPKGVQGQIHHHASKAGIRTETDWDRAAATASVVVADNTSVMWEALTMGIPVVAMTPPDWNDDAPHGFPRFGPDRIRLRTIRHPSEAGIKVRASIERPCPEFFPPSIRRRLYEPLPSPTKAAVQAIVRHLPT